MMPKTLPIILGASLASAAAITMTGCSSSSSGGGVPANATVFAGANAQAALVDAFAVAALFVETVEFAVVNSILIPCTTGNITESGGVPSTVGTNTTWSGSIVFDSCEIAGVVIGGTINYSITSDSNGPESTDITGNVNFTESGETFTISALNFKETGNNGGVGGIGNYTTNIFSFSLSSSLGGGFQAQLTQPLVGSDLTDCPDSAVVLLSGGGSTFVQGTFVGSGSSNADVTIEVDSGTGFSEISGSPVVCTDIIL